MNFTILKKLAFNGGTEEDDDDDDVVRAGLVRDVLEITVVLVRALREIPVLELTLWSLHLSPTDMSLP